MRLCPWGADKLLTYLLKNPYSTYMNTPHIVVGLGELLWDKLPTGNVLGGAPANVLYHTQKMGLQSYLITSIGNDTLGEQALELVASNGLPTQFIQDHPTRPTGYVDVTVEAGRASYTFAEDTAWDAIEFTDTMENLASTAQVIVYGTLAQRSEKSKETIQKFLASAPQAIKFCDINIRKPYISTQVIKESLEFATILKINEDEIHEVLIALDMHDDDDPLVAAHTLLNTYSLQCICLTREAHGSRILVKDYCIEHTGIPTTVQDTIGAGDAFAAAFIYHVLHGNTLEQASNAANTLGSWVASHQGATPQYSDSILQAIKLPVTHSLL